MNRTTLISIMLMLSVCSVSAQYGPENGTLTEIETPNRNPVPDSWVIDPEPLEVYEIAIMTSNFYDTYSEQIIQITRDASSCYNCHGYAWRMTEEQWPAQIWIGYSNPDARNAYLDDSSFVTVPFGFATKVAYPGHSAIIKSYPDSICESKMSNGPRFTHKIYSLPLTSSSPYVCYARPIKMGGSIPVHSTTGTYHVNTDTDLSGTSYMWTVGPFLSITSGGNTRFCTVSKTYRFPGNSGDSWINARLIRNNDTLEISEDINLGPPANITISGPTSPCTSTTVAYTVNNIPPEATIVWGSGTGLTRTSAQGANPCNFSVSGSGTSHVTASVTYTGLTYNIPNYDVNRLSMPVPPTPTMNVVGASGSGGNYTVSLNSSPVYFTLYDGGGYSYGWDTWGITSRYEITGNALDLYPNVAGWNRIAGYAYNACHQSQSVTAYLEVTQYRLLLSPNPASQFVDIELVSTEEELMIDGDYSIDFVDSFSKIAKRETLSGNKNRVNIQDLSKGFYVVTLRYGKDSYKAKLLVE